jgi:phosphoglucosamine mutase
MTRELFGTDGIRAVAGEFPLDFSSICALGDALTGLLRTKSLPPTVLIGRDTRESGPWIEKAIVQGVIGAGGRPSVAGVIPTSAVSYLTKKDGFSAGIVISASHNPFRDNGIKIFSPTGIKIPEDWERELETAILRERDKTRPEIPAVLCDRHLTEEYEEYLISRVRLYAGSRKLKIVLDCANGASSDVAPQIFRDLGCSVVPLNTSPDGTNINNGCGSLYPEGLARAVVETKADLGVAYDGDADRAVWVDENGRILNGDHTLYVLALSMKEAGRLRSGDVVATTMSNMGLEKALEKEGLRLIRTRVGDKYVLEDMIGRGANLGGEQSGHTIFLDDMPTGDGILTSLKMVEVMLAKGQLLAGLVRGFEEFPQLLVNVPVARKTDFGEFPDIAEAIDDVRRRLKGRGRVDVRYSGTERLARIMVEGPDAAEIRTLADRLAGLISLHLGR